MTDTSVCVTQMHGKEMSMAHTHTHTANTQQTHKLHSDKRRDTHIYSSEPVVANDRIGHQCQLQN